MQLTAEIDPQKTYRLLQLTPQLESSLRKGHLSLRSNADGSVYACTEESTHSIRVLKQTNTLLLSKVGDNNKLRTFSSPANTLETVTVPGMVDWSQVPVYSGKASIKPATSEKANISCSDAEFSVHCREKPATFIGNTLYSVATSVVYNISVNLVSSMVEAGDFDSKTPFDALEIDTNDPIEVIKTVYRKFQRNDGSALDASRISHFTGLYLLSKHPDGVDVATFIKEWRLDMPISMETDIKTLYGHLVEVTRDPSHTIIKPLNPAELPTDAKLRFHRLFAIKQEWPIAEIEPFIRELVPHNQKLDSWVLKYARKTRVNSDIYLVPLRRQPSRR